MESTYSLAVLFQRGLYIRSAEGAFSYVGPLTPPLAEEESSNSIDLQRKGLDEPVAATSDYGHVVLFAADLSAYWPFDLTTSFRGSLYEYSGTVSERTGIYKEQPILVGVSGGKGSKQLLGICGTHLGGAGLDGGSSTFNALSSDGESIFFTVLPGCGSPVTAEVYARLHGSLSSAVAAETVHVSASECTVACVGESGKNFEGVLRMALGYFSRVRRSSPMTRRTRPLMVTRPKKKGARGWSRLELDAIFTNMTSVSQKMRV